MRRMNQFFTRPLALGALLLSGCAVIDSPKSVEQPSVSMRPISCTAGKDHYNPGETVRISCERKIAGGALPRKTLQLIRLDRSVAANPRAVVEVEWAGQTSSGDLAWQIPVGNSAIGAYAITAGAPGPRIFSPNEALGFVRVMRPTQLKTFQITKEKQKGIDALALDGGLSAEYAIEKSIGSLAGLPSHSWYVSRPGNGPNPVFATPNFLRNALEATVDAYDKELGNETSFDTVIISTGFPSIPYLSQALNAPVLPLHFLASADSLTEVRGVLDGAKQSGHAAYATLGHDPSLDHSVAWIKLLDLPREYQDFITRHRVKRVIVLGSTGVSDGETKARRFGGNASAVYQPGEVYIMYPGTSHSDEESLNDKIVDLSRASQLSDFVRIADWESGVANSQVCQIGASIKASGGNTVDAFAVTPDSLGDLYNLASTVTIALMAKNRGLYATPDIAASGIVLNPYLMAYPGEEFRDGYVPLVYFQVVPAADTLRRIEAAIRPAMQHYFPERDVRRSRIWVNSSKNFGGAFFGQPYEQELLKLGYLNVRVNDYDIDEQWRPASQKLSISEILANDEKLRPDRDRLKSWAKRRVPLSQQEFEKVIGFFPGMALRDISNCAAAGK